MRDEPPVLTLPMTAAYYRLILRRFGTTAARRSALVAGARVPDADDEIPVRVQLRQLANLQRAAPSHWGLLVGAALDGSAHGPAGAAIVTAASLGDALDVLVRYATVRAPFIDLRATRTGRTHTIEVVERVPLDAVRTAMLEMVLLSTQWVVESALGRPMTGATVTMPAPRPDHWRRYLPVFHVPVAFDGRVAAISLPATWLRLRCPLADPVVHRSACTRLEAMRQRRVADFVDAEIEVLLDAGDDAAPSLAEVARRLRVSDAVQRRASSHGVPSGAAVPTQRSRRQRSVTVQALPSLQCPLPLEAGAPAPMVVAVI
jgi:hypothetical protein